MVVFAPGPADEPCCLGPVHESHGAVVAQEEVVRDLSDRRALGVPVPPDGEQQLVVRWRQPCRTSLLGAPGFEMA